MRIERERHVCPILGVYACAICSQRRGFQVTAREVNDPSNIANIPYTIMYTRQKPYLQALNHLRRTLRPSVTLPTANKTYSISHMSSP